MTPEGLTLYNIPMIDPAEVQRLVDYWKHTRPRYKLF
jgi:hypothetical protein